MNRSLRVLALSATAFTGLLALSACASAEEPSVIGAWGAPETRGEPSIVFEPDGSYTGNDGCNGIGGRWRNDTGADDTVDLGTMHSTRMFCEGVDTWLSLARSAELSGDTLTLLDEDGGEIGTLQRADD
ncbi:META domain-containing protein [Leucobacter chironomi]|uniref:META domain-containing protein n=1 Tax=Leucobacter chironomi TaxID=491918 RepID=UPI0004158A01|nr:META domain-containing protein [Leucobacter chironomi]